MPELWRLQWGGVITDSTSGGTPIEEWSCSLHTLSPLGGFSMSGITTSIVGLLQAYHQAANTGLSPTCRLDFMKFNQIDISTGLQITDPTNVRYFSTLNRGGGSSTVFNPLSASLRVSMDDGTRSRRNRGGYYLPRLGLSVGADGRVANSTMANLVTVTDTFLDGINGLADLQVGVYSRASASFAPSTRLRIGNVPDNVRRRRNELVEVYSEGVLSP